MRFLLSRSRVVTRLSTRLSYASLVVAQRFASNGVNNASAGGNNEKSTVTNKDQPYGVKATGLGDESGFLGNGDKNDWSKSYFGLSVEPFSKDVSDILLAPIDPLDVEIKPGKYIEHTFSFHSYYWTDGLLYLPEIKYRRVLNRAFGPGGWGLAPRSETSVSTNIVSREYALVCLGRYLRLLCVDCKYLKSSLG
jgi:hypothetical protein